MKHFLLFAVLFVISSVYFSILYLASVQFTSYGESDSKPVDSALFKFFTNSSYLRKSYNLTTNQAGPYEPPLIMSNTELCKNSPDLDWIVYFHTQGSDFDKRLRLRKTWANTQLFKDFSFKVIFVLGRTSDDIQQKVKEEFDKYGDIVQGDFVDTHRNLTLKAVLTFRWISTYCPYVPFALKADSDVFVNIFEILLVMRKNRHKPSVIVCKIWDRMPILRNITTCGKYCANESDLPGEKFYPPYCSGMFWIISRKLVKEFYEASKSTPFIFCEDAYMTGILPKKIPDTIDFVRRNNRIILKEKLAFQNYDNLSQPILYDAVHVHNPEVFVFLWNVLLDRLTDSEKAWLKQPIANYKVPAGELFISTHSQTLAKKPINGTIM